MREHLFFLLALLPVLATAQDDCLCCKKRQSGQAAYDRGDYKTAVNQWTRGQQTTDAANCPDLAKLIDNANQKKRDEAAAQRKREQAAAAQRQKDANDALERQRQQTAEAERQGRAKEAELQRQKEKADDDLWDVLKDGDAKTLQRYLDKYPYGRHADAARQQIKALAPVPTPSNPTSSTAAPSWLAFVKGNTFDLGDLFGDGSGGETAHKVTVNDFYLSKYEVSFDDFDAFCAATHREKPSDSGWGRGKRPVINVDWYDAVEYCNWRSQQENLAPCYSIDKTTKDPNNSNSSDTKKWTVTCNWSAKGYRLPTEAEWEYAAREGGKKVRFGNGRDVIDPSDINFDARSNYKKSFSVAGEYRQKTVPVDELSANALGLKNMSGNVLEWCWDWYGDKYYAESEGARNPSGTSSGQYRVLRGGSWYNNPEYCRSAVRYGGGPNDGYYDVGFRVVRPL